MGRSSVAAIVLVLLVAGAQQAAAQPGRTPPGQPPPGQPYPPPAPGPGAWHPPPPGGYHLLTPEERELLARGEITPGVHIVGGLVGTMFGFGTGQAVQGRFGDTGWIFLVGEAGSILVIAAALSSCGIHSCDDQAGWIVAGAIGLVGFRLWELIDVWAGPASHNRRVQHARARAYGGYPAPYYGAYLAPTMSDGGISGGVAGLSLRF